MEKSRKNKRTTIADIARETGYSTATVSRVVNRTNEFYSDETRRKVEEAISRLQYKPDIIARCLKEQRSYGIALLTPQIDEFYTGLYSHMNQIALKKGYALTLLSSQCDERTEAYNLALIRERNYDGVVVATGFLGNEDRALGALAGFPVVMVEASLPRPDASRVYIDVSALCREATRHLLENGHRRIAYISAPLTFDTLRDRYQGYRQALGEAGIELDEGIVFFDRALTQTSYENSYRLMKRILKTRGFTAMLVISDWAAFTAIKAAKEMSMEVPRDLSIVGFDDLPFTNFSEPSLTTVSQDQEAIGEAAMQLMLERIEGKPIRSVELSGKVVYRNSVTAPRP